MDKLIRKRLNFRWIFVTLLMLPVPVFAQLARAFIPDEVVVQYAGSIGYGSIGAGYKLFKKERGNLDIIYGYVPRSKGGALHIVTTKFAYRPFTAQLNKTATLYPLNPGVFLSYHLGKEFGFSRDREFFEKGYYWWSPALRTHLSISNELKINTGELLHDKGVKSFSLYSEFNTNDLYLISWFKNRESMSITDIFMLGVGVRLSF